MLDLRPGGVTTFVMDRAIIVPARLGSTRFPKKLLYEVRGRPLILWTAENIRRIAPHVLLAFAVADEALRDLLEAEGYACIKTDPDLQSGTDRIAVANRQLGARNVVNVQADEPVIKAEHISQLFSMLEGGFDVATLASRFASYTDFRDPNKVKVVFDNRGSALYFSRSPIPLDRDAPGALPEEAFWHMGVYGYTASALETFTHWSPGKLEQVERLEQLRFLENGSRIGVGETKFRTVGIDSPSDLPAFEATLDK